MEALQRYDEKREQLLDQAQHGFLNFVDEITAEIDERGSKHAGEIAGLQQEIDALKNQYGVLKSEYSRLSGAHSRIITRWTEEKKKIKDWISYLDKFRARQQEKHGRSNPFGDEPAVVRPRSPTIDTQHQVATHHPPPQTPRSSNTISKSNAEVQVKSSDTPGTGGSKRTVSETQATEDDEAGDDVPTRVNPFRTGGDDDDVPQIIAVKKVNHGRSKANQSEAEVGVPAATPRKIKNEASPYTQRHLALQSYGSVNESMDLDDAGPSVGTPRRNWRQMLEERFRRAEIDEADYHHALKILEQHDRALTVQTQQDPPGPLHDKSTNTIVNDQTKSGPAAKPQAQAASAKDPKAFNFIGAFTDDGAGLCENAQPGFATNKNASKSFDSRRSRLDHLLSERSPRRHSLGPIVNTRATSAAKSRSEQPASSSSTNNKRKRHTDTTFLQPTTTTRSSVQPGEVSEGSSRKRARDGTRLRDKPLSSLKPEDFRVNPKTNQGMDYAFAETVRIHENRRCLPNCTKPECCGDKFRRLVEIGGLPATTKQGPRWNSQDDDDEERDMRLLEGHMGLKRANIREMGADKRKMFLEQAKVEELAKKHGKHRNAFERAKTPPGYWRTGMPSTQELEDDRTRAVGDERRKVEERYKEALKEGGRWIFQDE